MAVPDQLLFPVLLLSERKKRILFFWGCICGRGLLRLLHLLPPHIEDTHTTHRTRTHCNMHMHEHQVNGDVYSVSVRPQREKARKHPARFYAALEIRNGVAHSGTFTQIAHVSAHGPGENIHGLQTHMDKHKCTKRT